MTCMSTPNTHYGAEEIAKMLDGRKSIFFIGIGGITMSSLAHISLIHGFRVGGSDRTETALTDELARCGIDISYTEDPALIEGYEAVVYTVAISPDNPQYKAALRQGLPCISRADYLGYIMTGYKNRVGISGMHGKSTCTSMCALAFMEAGGDPTVVSGAELSAMGGAYRLGGRDNFVFEACEYMDSFLDFNPTVAVVLNIEMDHVDYFSSIAQIRRSFASFMSLSGAEGRAVINADDENVMLAARLYGGEKITVSTRDPMADYSAANIVYERGRAGFDILHRGEREVSLKLSVPGAHNVYNALAAYAAARCCGLDPEGIARGLAKFGGAHRRMEYKGSFGGAEVYDDYGHHPTEIRATLGTLRQMAEGRLVCVFQSHTYSRTAKLFEDFASALCLADRVIVADIYAARETDTMGVSCDTLAREIENMGGSAVGGGSFENIADLLRGEIGEGDTLVVMGAGDIYKLYPLIGLSE